MTLSTAPQNRAIDGNSNSDVIMTMLAAEHGRALIELASGISDLTASKPEVGDESLIGRPLPLSGLVCGHRRRPDSRLRAITRCLAFAL